MEMHEAARCVIRGLDVQFGADASRGRIHAITHTALTTGDAHVLEVMSPQANTPGSEFYFVRITSMGPTQSLIEAVPTPGYRRDVLEGVSRCEAAKRA